MKKLYKVLLCISVISLLCLTACRLSKDSVSLKGESALKRYAKENCSDCTFVRYEEQEYKHIAYFTDDKYGFEFPVSSEVSSVSFDGATAGYEETTKVGWDFAYYNFVLDNAKDESDKICTQYGMTIERETHAPTLVLFRLHSDRPYEQLKDGLIKLGDLIRKEDVCEKYKFFDMRVYPVSDQRGSFYAFYRFKDGKTGEYEQWQAYRFMDYAESQLDVKCTYERTEEIATRDIPGITKLQNYSDKTGGKKIKVFYFTTEKGEKKFIADYREKYNVYYIGSAE